MGLTFLAGDGDLIVSKIERNIYSPHMGVFLILETINRGRTAYVVVTIDLAYSFSKYL